MRHQIWNLLYGGKEMKVKSGLFIQCLKQDAEPAHRAGSPAWLAYRGTR